MRIIFICCLVTAASVSAVAGIRARSAGGSPFGQLSRGTTGSSADRSYRRGPSVYPHSARDPSHSGLIASVTYECSDGEVVAVSQFQFDTCVLTAGEIAKLVSGAKLLERGGPDQICSKAAADYRLVFERSNGSVGIVRGTELALTLISTRDLSHAVDVEKLWSQERSQVPPAPPN